MESTVQYLKGLKERLDGAIAVLDTDGMSEETEILVQNAFQEIDGMEFRLACNHDGSVYAEKLIRLANEFQLRVFWDRLTGCFGRMAVHRYASHVLEALLSASAVALAEGGAKEADVSAETGVLVSLKEKMERVESELMADIDGLLKDTYSSHVLRLYIEKFTPSNQFMTAIMDTWSWSWTHPTASMVLQAALCKSPNLFDPESVNKQFFMTAAKDKIGSRTCESFLEAMTKTGNDGFAAFYQRCIRNEVVSMARDKSANFVIQALIANLQSDAMFSVILDELSQDRKVILDKMGILFKIMDWPVRRGRAFDKAIQFMYDVFEAKTPDAKQALVSRLLTSQIGLSILSLLPKYPADLNRFHVDGFLDLSDTDLVNLAMDRTAAHCVESLLTGNLGQKAKSKLCRKLVPSSANLAANPSGSFVLEKCFQAAPIDLKEAIANQLASGRKRVQDSRCGSIILRKLSIEQYERQREEWRASILAADKKRSILDIINDDSEPKSGKRIKHIN